MPISKKFMVPMCLRMAVWFVVCGRCGGVGKGKK